MGQLEAHHEGMLASLEARFDALMGRFKEIDAEADRRIVRWRYAVTSAFELQADYFRRFNEKAGAWIDEEPTAAYIYTAYGINTKRRIACSAVFQSEELPRVYRFYEYGDHGGDSITIDFAEFGIIHHTEDYRLGKVGRLVQAPDQRPLYYGEFTAGIGQGQWMIEVYQYDAEGRMAQIETMRRVRPRPLTNAEKLRKEQTIEQQRMMANMMQDKEQAEEAVRRMEDLMRQSEMLRSETWQVEQFEYTAGELQRIVSRFTEPPSDVTYVEYEAPRPSETAEMLAEAARTSLKREVVEQTIAYGAAAQGPFYCLVLSYDAVVDDGLMLLLGTEADRKAGVHNPFTDPSFPYPPYIMNGGNSISIWSLPDEYARFLRENRREEQWDEIRDLINGVARELNEHPWEGVLNITDDFIVYASDYEALEDPADEIRACVPEHKLKLLKARGVL